MPRLSKKNLKSKQIKKRNSNKRLRVSSRKNTKRTTLRGGADTIDTIVHNYSDQNENRDFFMKKADYWQELVNDVVLPKGKLVKLMGELKSKSPREDGAKFDKLEELVEAANSYFSSLGENITTDDKKQTITYVVNITKKKEFEDKLLERYLLVRKYNSKTHEGYGVVNSNNNRYDEAVEYTDTGVPDNNYTNIHTNFYSSIKEYAAVTRYLWKLKDEINYILEHRY
jgi:hypothetical protein